MSVCTGCKVLEDGMRSADVCSNNECWFVYLEESTRKNQDSEDVNRILDALLSQGNGEEISFWVWDHMCGVCEYRKAGLVKED